jgi:phage repressor protein C with HTH and peptisase S24 domain
MQPTLRDGDRLLLDHRRTPKTGDVAVVRLPDGVLAVKRLEMYDDGWWVSRDNPDEGVDSWTLGAPVDAVLAVAVVRLWPRSRRL